MNIRSKFCIGISKPLDVFNKNIRKLIYYSLDKNIFVHASISYPINFVLIKFLLKKKIRHRINFICKILGNDFKNFNKTVKLTFSKFSIKKIYILQLVNLPIKNNQKRDISSIDFYEFNKILKSIDNLKKNNLVEKVYLQIFSNDELEFCSKISNYFDGFAFYSNLKEVHLKREVHEFIKNKDIPCLVLSIFGTPNNCINSNKNLHIDSYAFSQSYFSKNTIAVGRTSKYSRVYDIYNVKNKKFDKKLIFRPKYVQTTERQDTAQNFYKKYHVTTNLYIFIFIVKCIGKKILSQKIWFFLKKLIKNNEN
jgi:hypothetical protein